MEIGLFDGWVEQHYQPIVDLKTMRIGACEALMRPKTGRPADKVTQEMERSGLIRRFDLWSINKAIAKGESHEAPVLISVNLSGLNVCDPVFFDRAMALLSKKPEHVKIGFEITESMPINCMIKAARFVGEAQALGCTVGLDDLYTGHSSLATATALGLDFIKLPGEITKQRIAQSEEMIRQACRFAGKSGLMVVAEHIDDLGQLVWLKSLGVTHGQGWLFAKATEGIDHSANYAHVLKPAQELTLEAAINLG
ncbi:EAL domain-containing protein [Pseudomonas sp. R-28-1W-6]|uniref:EAL domain-containing protein n=1 Tax=Pseudomonas sp. R-28-1W-6 TaxID=2650101 RepID=UPI001366397C|nr:EAL domain-containing protein [Pseudomonas sp. R-28-1W-6]MWV14211.1 EAL domain-containing protein [Pseudomonas sp. R-28-1W-6]